MPEIRLQHVVSCSSEDKNYAAENLVSGGGFKKWKSKNVGEKQISVTFQLEKASQIHQIDVGNEGAAFVEVLVGKSSATDNDYQVILVASSFLSPLDARAGKNMTSVRMFGPDKLSKAALDEKWDRVKVVCTQPFNKTIQYGLAFIKIYSPPQEGDKSDTKKEMTLGGFKLKSDDADIKPGTLFSTRDKEKASPAPLTGAAAVRAASKMAEETQKHEENNPQVKRKHSEDHGDRHLTNQQSSSHATPPPRKQSTNEHSSKHATPPPRKQSTSEHSSKHATPPLRKQSTSISSTASSASKHRTEPPPLKKTKSEPPKCQKEVAFDRIMKKVVFVLSGYQNPERGKIRDKAMEMGAEYQADWGKRCTHLICAFENTPKFNQVNGKGRIVKKDWVIDSYRAKRPLPWRKYRLGRAKSPPEDTSSSESEPEQGSSKKPSPKKTATPTKTASPAASDPYGGDTDSGDDTEDEIRRIQESEKSIESKERERGGSHDLIPESKERDRDPIYDVSTDEEMNDHKTNGVTKPGDDLPPLPDLFKGRKFFFYGSMEHTERRKLNRCIVAYNGSVSDYMNDQVSYVITESSWDDNFDQALTDIPSLSFIKPDWVYSCDAQQKMLPFQKFVVVPQ